MARRKLTVGPGRAALRQSYESSIVRAASEGARIGRMATRGICRKQPRRHSDLVAEEVSQVGFVRRFFRKPRGYTFCLKEKRG